MPSALPPPVSPIDLERITTETASAPSDLIDLQESLLPPPPLAAPRRRWAFRGQSQDFGTLVPSFQRIFRQKRSRGAAEAIEQDLIRTFRKHYATLDRTPDMPDSEMIRPDYELRCLSVMQHYGVPSRLLDWTSNFWTAVYFACAGDPSKPAELWIYDRAIFDEQLQTRPDLVELLKPVLPGPVRPPREPDYLMLRNDQLIAELDPQISPRMKEQEAHHTFSCDVFADHAPLLCRLANLADKARQPDEFISFRRVLIAPSCKEKALRFLEGQKAVTAGTIFPDVEGLGKFLHWHLESLVTTLM